MIMLAEGFLEPLTLPSGPLFIVIWSRTSGLEVGNEGCATIFENVSSSPFQTSNVHFLLCRKAVVDRILGKYDEGCALQDGPGINGSNVAQSRMNQLHKAVWEFRGVILVVNHNSELMLAKLGSCPTFLQDGLLVTLIAEGFLFLDEFPTNLSIIIECRTSLIKEDSSEEVEVA